ncbi:MAG: ribosomal RNA small subunit methyltransferase A [Firmicutes bacterium]|nr:ribosomal RNA small subunit methyltransferase A [Bacillota bacterium]
MNSSSFGQSSLGKLTSLSFVSDVARRHNIGFKRQLGQHLLVDRNILLKILAALEPGPDELVFEIGPGFGVLTRALAERAGHVVAVEIDARMVAVLEETLRECTNITLVHGDALDFDFGSWSSSTEFRGFRALKVAGNLPYCITTPLLFKILEGSPGFEAGVFLVQKEVAGRMAAGPGTKEYGALSVALQYRSVPKVLGYVSRTAFFPRPEVDSAIVRLSFKERELSLREEELLAKVVRASFNQRRKMLRGALAGSPELAALGLRRETVEKVLADMGVSGTRRGETLSLHEFMTLARALSKEAGDKLP